MRIVPMYPTPYKLKIQLEHTDIYRIVLVPSDINMLQLHLVCQEAMGWMMAHLFQFSDNKVNQNITAGLPESDEDFGFGGGPREEKADEVKLSDFHNITNAKPFWYWYDFGDDWWHKISFQKPTKKDLEIFKEEPVCVKGEKACPPEDIGGVGGYFYFLEVMEEKNHPEKEYFMEIMGLEEGDKFDADYFDLEEVNEYLSEVYHSDMWSQTTEDYF